MQFFRRVSFRRLALRRVDGSLHTRSFGVICPHLEKFKISASSQIQQRWNEFGLCYTWKNRTANIFQQTVFFQTFETHSVSLWLLVLQSIHFWYLGSCIQIGGDRQTDRQVIRLTSLQTRFLLLKVFRSHDLQQGMEEGHIGQLTDQDQRLLDRQTAGRLTDWFMDHLLFYIVVKSWLDCSLTLTFWKYPLFKDLSRTWRKYT